VLRVSFLAVALIGFWLVGLHAKNTGASILISYIFSSFLAWSWATPFRIVRGIPLGVAAPFCIFIGVVLSDALKPVVSEVVKAAIGGELAAAALLLCLVAFLITVANKLKQGQPPDAT